MNDIQDWLRANRLEQHEQLFLNNDIDLEILVDISEADLSELGLSLGERKKVIRAIKAYAQAHDQPVTARVPEVVAARPDAGASLGSAERRYVTVMFCDLVGSTELSNSLDPEDMRELLLKYHEVCKTQISRFGGQVADFYGDGVLAYFGHPKAHEDDPERAVRSGHQIIAAAAQLSGREGAGVRVRIGLATGPVIVEDMLASGGWAEQSATGRTINLAARIQSIAEANSIAVDARTHALVNGLFDCTPLGLKDLKGFDTPVGTWCVQPEDSNVDRFVAAHGQSIFPLVGRAEELTLLVSRWRRAEAGSGQAVLLTAEAGIGKSRLLLEFTDTLEKTRILRGQCVSFGHTTPFLPIVDMLRRLIGVRESDQGQSKRIAVQEFLRQEGFDPDLEPYISYLLGGLEPDHPLLSITPDVRQARLHKSILQLLIALCAVDPIVVAVEDVHWMDKTSEAFLAMLVEHVEDLQLCLVCTHRPSYQAPWLGKSAVSQITLSPLDRSDSIEMLEHILGTGDDRAGVFSAIADKAQGNALFIEELSRSVTDTGEALSLPETIHGVLMSRIDSLPRNSRHALQTASVLGREFHFGVLEALWRSQDNIHKLIAELQNLQFLYNRIEEEDRILGFRHALIQDAAYESLLHSRRRELHLEAAKAIEQLFPKDLSEMANALAFHYEQADEDESAIKYILLLADRALGTYALTEAEDALRKGLKIVSRQDDRTGSRLAIKQRLSQLLYLSGRFEESVDLLQGESEALFKGDMPQASAPCLFWLSHMLVRLARHDEAVRAAHAAQEQAEAIQDVATLGKAFGVLCLEHCLTGEMSTANDAGKRSVSILEEAGEKYWLGMSEFYQGMVEITVGDFASATTRCMRASRISEMIADNRLNCYAKFLWAWASASAGQAVEAIEIAEQAVDIAPDPTSRSYAIGFHAFALLKANDPKALPCLLVAQEEISKIGFRPFEGLFLAYLSEAQTNSQDFEAALVSAEAGVSAAQLARYPLGQAWAQRAAARAASALGDTSRAQVAMQAAEDLFNQIGARHEARATVQLSNSVFRN